MNSETTGYEALILSGGKGTRLQNMVNDRPKSMAEVAGRPFLEWLLFRLSAQGVRSVILCTGYMGEMLEAHFRDGSRWNMDIKSSFEQKPLGTAGAVRKALDLISGERFLVLNGDSYCRFNLLSLRKIHENRKAYATMWLVKMDDCRRYGSVVIDDRSAVLSFQEKSNKIEPGLINAGIYILERELVKTIPTNKCVSLEKEIFPKLLGLSLYAVPSEGPFIDIGTPEAYIASQKFFLQERYLLCNADM